MPATPVWVGKGVIFLRIIPATVQSLHGQLELLLRTHSEAELANPFVVVEPGQHRFRKLA